MNTKPNILVFTSSFPYGRDTYSGNFIKELSAKLKKKFKIVILSPTRRNSQSNKESGDIKHYWHKQFPVNGIYLADGNPIMAKLNTNKFNWLTVPFFLFYQLIKLRKVVNAENISVIHAHWIIPQGLIAVVYKKLFNKRIKIIVTAHGTDINGFKGTLGKRIIKYVLINIDKLTVVSDDLKDTVEKMGYKKNTFVIPMGVDTEVFSPSNKKKNIRLQLKIDREFILFVGSLIKAKGIHLLINAMPKVLQAFPSAKLVIVGKGQLKSKLIGTSKNLGISNNIIFAGAISNEELPPYYSAADLFVLPSFSEGLSVVIQEALSCKTLVLASHLKVFEKLVIENETGFYLNTISSENISNKIIEILKHNINNQQIRDNGRKHVVDNFDWDIISEKYNNLLLSL